MSVEINRVFDPIVNLFQGNKRNSRSRKFRYKTVLKGTVLSKHFTKAAANKAAKKVSGARVLPISAPVRRVKGKTTLRKTRRIRR